MMPDRFVDEDDVKAAYEAAEFALGRAFRGTAPFQDWRTRDFENMVRRVARDVADAVIRSGYVDGDITDIPGVTVEEVSR